MTTHTPLPWKVEDNLPGSEGNVWIYAPNAADVWHRTVASVGDMEEIDGEDLANAEFIVHACNSHDDLVTLAELVAADYEDAADWKDAKGRMQTLAYAALAKATGEQL
jgi:hypothetical protein